MRRAACIALVLLAACGDGSTTPPETTTTAPQDAAVTTSAPTDGACADVVDVEATRADDGTWRFDTTVASPDTGWDKYADLWLVLSPDGTVLGERVLTHPHVDEQPFTRSLSGVSIPDDVSTVEVAARDSVEGFCGATMDVDLP